MGMNRYQDVVLQRRATRLGRRQQDPHWQQVRLGRETRRLHGAGPGPRRRTGHPLPRGIRKVKHQCRPGVLLSCCRYQEAHHRHAEPECAAAECGRQYWGQQQ